MVDTIPVDPRVSNDRGGGSTSRHFGGELRWSGARWYSPTDLRWLEEDPSGLAPDSNPYRYCANDPIDGTDPTGLADYRKAFMDATPNMPARYEVHHVVEQGRVILAERFTNELGVDIDGLDNLRGATPEIHREISKIQSQFWSATAKGYNGNLEEAYKKIPLDDVKKLQQSIEATYSGLWIEARATAADVASVEKLVSNPRVLQLKPARVGSTLNKVGIVATGFAIFLTIESNASLAKNILDPPADVQAALDNMLVQYAAVYQQNIDRGKPTREQWSKLQDATMEYLRVAGVDEKAQGLVLREFSSEGFKLD
jgi:RHS repeat-associated protein